jgi:hypothetical protein
MPSGCPSSHLLGKAIDSQPDRACQICLYHIVTSPFNPKPVDGKAGSSISVSAIERSNSRRLKENATLSLNSHSNPEPIALAETGRWILLCADVQKPRDYCR